jgi:hypothetical protein
VKFGVRSTSLSRGFKIRRRRDMPKIQHIAIVSPKRDALVEFYKKAFGMKQVEGEGSAVYLSDGAVNLALIQQYPAAMPACTTLVLKSRTSRR